ncbi:MAG: hypothetical protein GY952_09515, partial [Rhodobacteraceae bacterium]|nr:hypothetical protein [Paracoccaceae bacterium]
DPNETQKLVDIISISTNYAALTLAAVYSIAWTQISVGLGIAKDIVVFFVRRPVPGLENKPGVIAIEENGVPYLMVPKKGRKAGQATTEMEKVIVYPNRTRIQQRFKIVYEALLECENPEEVVVVSHSQGTLIALESLRDGRLESQISEYVAPTLITMGSPTWHIYNYYFSSGFPIDVSVKDGIARWVNIFRIDDFVGTTVECVEPDGQETDAAPQWPDNISVQPRGHTGYWNDDDVRAHLVVHGFQELS